MRREAVTKELQKKKQTELELLISNRLFAETTLRKQEKNTRRKLACNFIQKLVEIDNGRKEIPMIFHFLETFTISMLGHNPRPY